MPAWRSRAVDTFPHLFHEAMRLPLGEHIVQLARQEYVIRKLQQDWRLFTFCVRNSPETQFRKLYEQYARRSYCRFDTAVGAWAWILTVSERPEDLLAEAEVLPISIDSPPPL